MQRTHETRRDLLALSGAVIAAPIAATAPASAGSDPILPMIDNTYRLQARTQMLWQKAVSLRAVVDTHPENPGLMPPAVYPGETADWIRTTVNPIWNRFGLNRAYDEANAADTVARQAFTDMWKVEPRTIEGAIAKLKVAAHVVHGKLMDGELPLDSLHPELWVNEVSRDLADQAISELEAVWRVS